MLYGLECETFLCETGIAKELAGEALYVYGNGGIWAQEIRRRISEVLQVRMEYRSQFST